MADTEKFDLWREPNKEWQELLCSMEINVACASEQAATVDVWLGGHSADFLSEIFLPLPKMFTSEDNNQRHY